MADTLLEPGAVTDATVQPGNDRPDFRIYTGSIVPYTVDDPNSSVVRMIGSSNQTDLQGDTMLLSALQDMTRAEAGLSIWMNHRYDLPGDLFGSLTKSPQVQIADGIADVMLEVDTELNNPPAALTYSMIKSGRRKLGCSIGCIVTDYDVAGVGDEGYQPIDVIHLLTLEYSVVGIPCNQRSWVENAVKGIFERTLDYRLAPAVKGLFPQAFEAFVEKNVHDKELREYFVKCAARPAEKRIYWDPMKRAFSLYSQTGKGILADSVVKEMVRGAVDTRTLEMVAAPVKKGASGSTSWPLADRDKAWDAAAAHARIFGWARGDKGPGEFDASKAQSVHFWYDSSAPDKMGSYKLPFCDIVSGSPVAIPRGIFAVAGSLGGSRGGLNIPDSDVSKVRSRVSAYYSKMRSKFSDDSLVPPWEKNDSIEEVEGKEVVALMKDPTTGLDVIEVEGVMYARTAAGFVTLDKATAPVKPIDQVTIDETGNHEKTVGTHTHIHKSYGYTKAAGSDTHKHKHTHGDDQGNNPDNDHKHTDDHADQGYSQGGGNDNDADDAQKMFSTPFRRQVESFKLLGSTVGPELTRKAVDMQAVVTLASYIDQCSDTLAKEIDQLLVTLGIPNYDDGDSTDPRTTYGMVSSFVKALITHKEGKKLGKETMKALQGMHDTLKSMTEGVVCSQSMTNPQPPTPGGNGTSLEDARATADAANDRDPYSGLMQDMANLTAGLQKAGTSSQALTNLQKQLDALKIEVGKYIDAPQGRPTGGNTTLASAPGSATSGAPQLGDKVLRRQRSDGVWTLAWPKGYSPAGGRPPLSTDEMSLMSNGQIMAYINGDEADVPDLSNF